MFPCHCLEQKQCPILTGVCPGEKCEDDWEGKRCDVSKYTLQTLLKTFYSLLTSDKVRHGQCQLRLSVASDKVWHGDCQLSLSVG